MEQRLIELIDQIPDIEKSFQQVGGEPGLAIPVTDCIYSNPDFQNWKNEVQLELQDIEDRTNNKFIADTLEAVSKTFNGWRDREDFNDIKGKLLAIKRNIDQYYEESKRPIMAENRSPKIFISHSSKDKPYVSELVNLLDGMGLDHTQVFCSSMPGYDIPVSKKIFEYLREQFLEHKLLVIFVHSDNYYSSPVSLNEMGAAWALKDDFISFLLPGFEFSSMRGVVNSDTIAIKLDSDETELKDKLNQFYDMIINMFGIVKKPGIIWEKKRDSFIRGIVSYTPADEKIEISGNAIDLIRNAAAKDGVVLKVSDLSGTSIQAGDAELNVKGDSRDTAKWEAAVDELLGLNLLVDPKGKGELFKLTNNAYEFLDAQETK